MRLSLDHHGAGIDAVFRRWVLRDHEWHCIESSEVARQLTIPRALMHRTIGWWFRLPR
jgi:hypothetical protein